MKKRIIRNMVLMVSLCLLFAVGSIKTYAATGTVTDANGTPIGQIEPFGITTGDATDLSSFNAYRFVVNVDTASTDGYTHYIIPINVAKPGAINAQISDLSGYSSSFYVEMYTDAALTTEVSYGWSSGDSDPNMLKVETAGIYYLHVKFYNRFATSNIIQFTFKAQAYNGVAEKPFNNNIWDCSNIDYNTNEVWYKVVANKTGVITVENDPSLSNFSVELYNGSKSKALSEKIPLYDSANFDNLTRAIFAVKKGTYYIKATNIYGLARTKVSFTAKKDVSGTSKKKATAIKSGATKKGVLLATDKKSKYDWYKFTITKRKKVTVTLSGQASSGAVKYELYQSNGDKFNGYRYTNRTSTKDVSNPYLVPVGSSARTLPKGTYYLKISKYDATSSGSYSIKVK